jgi:hypothetical protein
MAILVLIRKESESDLEAVYLFGPDDGRFGRLMIDKRSGEIVKLSDVAGDQREFNYSRASRRLKDHFARGEFPQETLYTA